LAAVLRCLPHSCRKLREVSVVDVDCITDRSVLALVTCGSGLPAVQMHRDVLDDAAIGITHRHAVGA
jgi:hypothetical protein